MRVLIIEDQLLFCDFLKGFIEKETDFEVVGIANDGPSGLDAARTLRPDLVLLDILIPKLSGIIVAKTISDEFSKTKILGLSSECDPKTIIQIHSLKLAGFIDKSEASQEILKSALQSMADGKRFFSESIQKALHELLGDPNAFQKILTKREQEVLTFIGGGLSDPQIGKILGLSPSSVQSHRKNLFKKLEVKSTPELIKLAQRFGFWKPEFDRMDLSQTYHLHK